VRPVAEEERRQLQALVDEAVGNLIEKQKNAKPRRTSWACTSPATKNRSAGDPCRPDRMLCIAAFKPK